MSWERRYGLLLGLTGAAGALDALCFVYLGKVFSSFQSGNVLFLGLGVGQGNGGLVVRAGAVLAGFFLATAVGAHLLGTQLSPAASYREFRMLAIEMALLVMFAAAWLVTGTPAEDHIARVVILFLGAAAMGFQASLALALKVPNVITVALTATVAELGRRAGTRGVARARAGEPSSALLAVLALTYIACAAVLAVLPETPALALAPLLLLSAGGAVESVRSRSSRPGSAHGMSPVRHRH